MNSKYITCYRRKGDGRITIYISNGTQYEGKIFSRFIAISGHFNGTLFDLFGINKWYLAAKLPYEYKYGAWPECKDPKGTLALLNALIKESKIRYYEATEL